MKDMCRSARDFGGLMVGICALLFGAMALGALGAHAQDPVASPSPAAGQSPAPSRSATATPIPSPTPKKVASRTTHIFHLGKLPFNRVVVKKLQAVKLSSQNTV